LALFAKTDGAKLDFFPGINGEINKLALAFFAKMAGQICGLDFFSKIAGEINKLVFFAKMTGEVYNVDFFPKMDGEIIKINWLSMPR
jgi:hypothetical protein